MCSDFIDCIVCVCRVEDYWVGYKLFCYAYYSHSVSHEFEFRLSKLGWCFLHFRVSHAPFLFLFILFKVFLGWHAHPSLYARDGWSLRLLNYFRAHGAAVWRQHAGFPFPSHHAIRTTCTQLLLFVEMYCKYELQEDCSNLGSLMRRFDSELELESHGLGRNLLSMIKDDDVGFVSVYRPMPPIVAVSPFDTFRERLAAAAMAIRDLRPHVKQLARMFRVITALA